MRQDDYNIIIDCIHHGAPALAPKLIAALNTVMEHANAHIQNQRKLAEAAAKSQKLADEKAATKPEKQGK